MTNRICRTRHDYFVGFWAIAPAIAFPGLFLAWNHHIEAGRSHILALDPTYSPVTGWMIAALFGVVVIGLVSLAVVVSDINRRPLSDLQRRMWRTLTVIGCPFGGAIYWMVTIAGYSTPRSRSSASRRSTASGASSGRRTRSGEAGGS